VLNAGNKHIDMAQINKYLSTEFEGRDVRVDNFFDEKSLVALQGPKAGDVLQKYVDDDLSKLGFCGHWNSHINGVGDAQIWRGGYTGEDGFEISVRNENTIKLCDKLFEDSNVAPAGLGARDSLRLEAGLCLHGNDITQSTTPFESVLMWLTRKEEAKVKYVGEEAVMAKKAQKRDLKRVGLMMKDKGIPRHDDKVFDDAGKEIGHITSGTFSPTLKIGLGMGYLKNKHCKVGTTVHVEVRGKKFEAEVTKMPFVPAGYY